MQQVQIQTIHEGPAEGRAFESHGKQNYVTEWLVDLVDQGQLVQNVKLRCAWQTQAKEAMYISIVTAGSVIFCDPPKEYPANSGSWEYKITVPSERNGYVNDPSKQGNAPSRPPQRPAQGPPQGQRPPLTLPPGVRQGYNTPPPQQPSAAPTQPRTRPEGYTLDELDALLFDCANRVLKWQITTSEDAVQKYATTIFIAAKDQGLKATKTTGTPEIPVSAVQPLYQYIENAGLTDRWNSQAQLTDVALLQWWEESGQIVNAFAARVNAELKRAGI